MKRNAFLSIGIFLLLIGVALFVYYYFTGEVLFRSYDEVTQIQDAKITYFAEYKAQGNYELMLLLLAFLSVFSGVVLLIIRKIFFKVIPIQN